MSKHLQAPRGTAIMFTAGEYSDFRTTAFIVTIKDCDLPALAQQFADSEHDRILADNSEYRRRDDPTDFPSWLIANGYAFAADYSELHLGSYGDWDQEWRVERKPDIER